MTAEQVCCCSVPISCELSFSPTWKTTQHMMPTPVTIRIKHWVTTAQHLPGYSTLTSSNRHGLITYFTAYLCRLSLNTVCRKFTTHNSLQTAWRVLTLQNTDKEENLPLSSNVQTLKCCQLQGGGQSPLTRGCPWTPLGALPPDPRYRVALRACHKCLHLCAIQNFP